MIEGRTITKVYRHKFELGNQTIYLLLRLELDDGTILVPKSVDLGDGEQGTTFLVGKKK